MRLWMWRQALGAAGVLVGFIPWLPLVWLLLWPGVLYVLMSEFVKVGQTSYVQAEVVRRSDYLRDLALTPAAAKELRIWGMTGWLVDAFDAAWLQAMAPVWRSRSPNRPIIWLTGGLVAAVDPGALRLLGRAAPAGLTSAPHAA